MTPYQHFETDRLLLRPTAIEDAALVLELLNTPKWLQFIGDRKVRSLADAEAYIQNRMQPQLERLGYSSYTLLRKEDGVKLGVCGLYDREGLQGVDLGFALLPAYERQGYGLEAARRIQQAGLEVFGLPRLLAITTKENRASQQLLQKLGFSCTGTTQMPNDEEELLLFECTSSPAASLPSSSQ